VRDRFRRLVEIYLAVYIALFLARVVFDWAFDVDGTPLLVVTIVLGVVGLAIGLRLARVLQPAPGGAASSALRSRSSSSSRYRCRGVRSQRQQPPGLRS
jgi:hypothetical protein